MVTIRWALLLLPLVFARPCAAGPQQPVPDSTRQRPTAVGSIRGEVYDSLLGDRLVGASVRVRGTGLRTTTDRRGRFRLDAVPAGRVVLLVDHPDLDSVGLSDVSTTVEVRAGAALQVRIATPSLGTFAAAACPGHPPAPRGDSGIVYGAVRDAESRQRLVGAVVTVSWFELGPHADPMRVKILAQDHLTDSLGNYYACVVPGNVELGVRAGVGPFASGELSVEIGERRVLRRDISLSREEPAASDTAPTGRRGRAVLAGRVRNEAGRPLEGVRAHVPGGRDEAVSDAAGRFVLSGQPSGSQMLYLRRIGYSLTATSVELSNADTARLEIALPTLTVLDTLRVTATRWGRAEIEDLERRLDEHVPGRVLLEADLKGIGMMSTAFTNFPALQVETGRRAGSLALFMQQGIRRCVPRVYIDGWPTDVELLQEYRPSDFLALEFYRPSEAPLRYQSVGGCGVVLAWTRSMR